LHGRVVRNPKAVSRGVFRPTFGKVDKDIPVASASDEAARMCRVVFDLFSNATDVHVHRPCVLQLIAIQPKIFEENIPAEHVTCMLHEERKQVELGSTQLFPLRSYFNLEIFAEEAKTASGENFFLLNLRVSS
jgi:hypothetical protein